MTFVQFSQGKLFAITALLPVRRVDVCKYYLSKLHAYDNSCMKVTNMWVISTGWLFESCVWTCGHNTSNAPVRCKAPRFFQTSVITSQHGVTSHKTCIYCNKAREDIQGDSKVDILGGDKMVNVRKKNSYERVSNSQWLPRESCPNLQTKLR
jgi:hypothetical protein